MRSRFLTALLTVAALGGLSTHAPQEKKKMKNWFLTGLLALAALAGLTGQAPQEERMEGRANKDTARSRYLATLLALVALASLSAHAQVASLGSARITPEALAAPPKGNFPDCKATLSSVAVPNAPHGLFVSIFPHGTLNDRAVPILLHNPVVCGANFYINWAESDHGPGANPRYEFGYIERQMTPWVAAGKVVNLIVWPTSDSLAVQSTPDYVMAKAPSVTCPKFGRIPVFWDKNFMEPYKQFMAVVADKYGNDPRIGYIRFGLSNGGETFPSCEFAMMKEKGLTQGMWKKYLFNMMEYEKSLHVTRQLMVGITAFGEPRDLRLPHEVAARAAELGMGIGSNGLQITDVQSYRAGGKCDDDWCRIFDEFAGKIPLESQPLHPNEQGSMGDMVALALEHKVQIFEFALPDWLAAYDPRYGQAKNRKGEYIAAFEAAAKVLGGQ